MSFRRETLFHMYNVGGLQGTDFRNEFPPETGCFELSLKAMLENKEIQVIQNDTVLSISQAMKAFDSKSDSADLSNIEVKLTPIGRNAALGGRSNAIDDNQELTF